MTGASNGLATSSLPASRPGAGDAQGKKRARIWWFVHQWVGLKLSVLLSFILLTGTLAIFSNEIDWMINADMRVDPRTVDGEVAWSRVAENAAAALPGGEIFTVHAPIDRGFAAAAMGRTADGDIKWVYAHPTTGAVQGVGGFFTVQRVLRYLHRHLMLPNKIGVPIVSATSILLFISLATSFVVYKKWWRGFFKPVRLRDARTATGDFHRLAGVWSLWFVALMAATGFWYLVESLGGRAPNVPRPDVAAVDGDAADFAAGVSAAIGAARGAYPDLRIRSVSLPDRRFGAYWISGQDDAILVRSRANGVYVAAATGRAALSYDAHALSVHQRIAEMADPLHFGTFGGVWTKLIWFVFGAVLTGLSISGAAIYSLRLAKQARQSPRWRRGAGDLWRGMGVWKWPSSALVFAGLVLVVLAIGRA
ncbi:MAG: PepSY-associated TM helix domain-containing protein [Pseudomonadota bacterium]